MHTENFVVVIVLLKYASYISGRTKKCISVPACVTLIVLKRELLSVLVLFLEG
jgi:hypothetical protein